MARTKAAAPEPLPEPPPAPAVLQHEFPGLLSALAPLKNLPEIADRQAKQASKSEAALVAAVEKRLPPSPCKWKFEMEYNREGRLSSITATPQL